jgi:nucleotide-binding universal stress UspA family protein
MRILIACDGSQIGESGAAAVSAWGADATTDVHLLSVIDPGDLHGVAESNEASSLFIGPATARGRVVPSPGRVTSVADRPGLLAPEAESPIPDNSPEVAEDRGQAIERARSEHFDYLRAVASCYFPGHEVEVDIAFSDEPAQAIADYADEIGADVIAVGSHGRSGLSRVIMGSVAGKLVERANVPVLVVGPAARETLPPAPGTPA